MDIQYRIQDFSTFFSKKEYKFQLNFHRVFMPFASMEIFNCKLSWIDLEFQQMENSNNGLVSTENSSLPKLYYFISLSRLQQITIDT